MIEIESGTFVCFAVFARTSLTPLTLTRVHSLLDSQAPLTTSHVGRGPSRCSQGQQHRVHRGSRRSRRASQRPGVDAHAVALGCSRGLSGGVPVPAGASGRHSRQGLARRHAADARVLEGPHDRRRVPAGAQRRPDSDRQRGPHQLAPRRARWLPRHVRAARQRRISRERAQQGRTYSTAHWYGIEAIASE